MSGGKGRGLVLWDVDVISGGVGTLQRALAPALAERAGGAQWVIPRHRVAALTQERAWPASLRFVAQEDLATGLGLLLRIARGRSASKMARAFAAAWMPVRVAGFARRARAAAIFSHFIWLQRPPSYPCGGYIQDIPRASGVSAAGDEAHAALLRELIPNFQRWISRADRIFTSSLHVKEELRQLCGAPEGRLMSVPLPLTGIANVGGTREVAAAHGRYLLMPAALKPNKDHCSLFKAFARVAAVDTTLRLLVCGPGTERLANGDPAGECAPAVRAFRSLADAVGDRVCVLGMVSFEELEALLLGAQAVVMPSLSEGFGLPVGEAIARGVPIVCSDIPPFIEQLDLAGDLAVASVAAAGEVDSLENALLGILRVKRPADLAERGRIHAERHTPERIADRILAGLEVGGSRTDRVSTGTDQG